MDHLVWACFTSTHGNSHYDNHRLYAGMGYVYVVLLFVYHSWDHRYGDRDAP